LQKPWIAVFAALITSLGLPAHASQVRSALSGLCIQPEDGLGSWNGSVIVQVPCDPYDDSSLWGIREVANVAGRSWFNFVNKAHPDFKLCLDLTDGRTADGTQLQLWECNSSSTMWWTFEDGRLVNFRSRKCMDVRAGSLQTGAAIQNYHCADLPDGQRNLAQIWNYQR
jgi:hypothetical protein